MIAEVATGASCNDPAGDDPEDNFLKRSSSESGEGPRVGWSLTTSSVLGTQVAQLCHDDHWMFLYWSGAIATADLVTGATCNDPTGDCPKVNSLNKSSLESGKVQGQTDRSQLLQFLPPRWLRWVTMIMKASSIDPER